MKFTDDICKRCPHGWQFIEMQYGQETQEYCVVIHDHARYEVMSVEPAEDCPYYLEHFMATEGDKQ